MSASYANYIETHDSYSIRDSTSLVQNSMVKYLKRDRYDPDIRLADLGLSCTEGGLIRGFSCEKLAISYPHVREFAQFAEFVDVHIGAEWESWPAQLGDRYSKFMEAARKVRDYHMRGDHESLADKVKSLSFEQLLSRLHRIMLEAADLYDVPALTKLKLALQ